MSNNSLVLATFIKQMEECFKDIVRVYPDVALLNPRFSKTRLFFETLKQTNPRLMIVTWKHRVNEKYKARILACDVNFFLEKDYRDDAEPEFYESTVEGCIDDLRQAIRNMTPVNIETAMKYIQNLCKLADLYTV